jgi:hypothetical protein
MAILYTGAEYYGVIDDGSGNVPEDENESITNLIHTCSLIS